MVLNRQKRVRVKLRALDEFLRRAEVLLRLPYGTATICLVTDAQIARWNHIYRGKDRPTDVLSFPVVTHASNGKDKTETKANVAMRHRRAAGGNEYLGDIAIAPAVARRNARVLGRSFDQEMRILALHGLLHLMGYDHEADNGAMERLEMRLRRKLRLAE
jgi:probable rRNA maturation factor